MKNEEEITEREKTLAVAKDLVELTLQTQKVLSNATISVSHIEEARLLVAMTNRVLQLYTKKKEKDEK